jgi:hypothetical protein
MAGTKETSKVLMADLSAPVVAAADPQESDVVVPERDVEWCQCPEQEVELVQQTLHTVRCTLNVVCVLSVTQPHSHMRVYTQTHTDTHRHTQTHTDTHRTQTHTDAYMRRYTNKDKFIYIHTFRHTHRFIYVRMHTFIHE